ncbi:hypothetical protein C8F01DRAFT_1147609 [Mycena amicta]|nr:hypothetical protein C8F01DRAFT_1147609 [Mycena amicta]
MAGVAPILPPELERHIFELAAWDDQETMSTLSLVARRGYIWIAPLRYRVIYTPSDNDLRRLFNIVDRKPETVRHIRYLALGDEVDTGATPSVLSRLTSTFSHLTDLALWGEETAPVHISELQTLKHLKRLSVNLSALLGEKPERTIDNLTLALARITHLDIFGQIGPWIVPALCALPELTHLSFYRVYVPEVIEDFLAVCSDTLRLVVIVQLDWIVDLQGFGVGAAAVLKRIDDPRFAVECSEFADDWVNGAWGGRDHWCRAEEAIAARAHAKSVSSEGQ